MPTHYLFPHRFKLVGWVLAGTGALLWLLEQFGLWELPTLMGWLPSLLHDAENPTVRQNHDLYAVLFVVGAVLAACSREKHEDEYIGQIRLDSLLWALYAYCILLVLAILLVSGMAFFSVMVYAMFTPLLLFLLHFQIGLALLQRTAAHD